MAFFLTMTSDFCYLNWCRQADNAVHVMTVETQDVITVISRQILLSKYHLVKTGTERN